MSKTIAQQNQELITKASWKHPVSFQYLNQKGEISVRTEMEVYDLTPTMFFGWDPVSAKTKTFAFDRMRLLVIHTDKTFEPRFERKDQLNG